MADVAVSIVLYKNSPLEYGPLVDAILADPRVATLWLVDHSPQALPAVRPSDPRLVQVHDPSNPGFGAGHNRALRLTTAQVRYHAVVNPDIEMGPGLLSQLAQYMDSHPDVGSVMPTLVDAQGNVTHQGRLLPSPWELVARRWFGRERRRTPRHQPSETEATPSGARNVPNLSGAFLFLRCEALETSGLFDERFFLYCEDLDLVRRLHQRYRTEALGSVRVVHGHRRASYRSWRMTVVHSWSAIRYFTKWGWWTDPERKTFNRKALGR